MKTYEMFWDCGFCGTEKLLGKTHRHCPACGGVQDPARRYFPPEEEKVAVEDHTFVGVDKKCENCDTPNSSISDYCTNCGVALDAAGLIEKLAAIDEGLQAGKHGRHDMPPDEPEEAGGGGKAAAAAGGLASTGCLIGCAGLIVVVGLVCLLNMFWTSETSATVVAQTWERTIEVEKLSVQKKDDWCSDMPRGAKERSRKDKKKSTKKVADGETCKTVNVDNGDGTFKKTQKCKPKYSEKQVMAAWCTYDLEGWSKQKTERASGDIAKIPRWPLVTVDGCKRLGCTREGKRKETYTVDFVLEGGGRDSCALTKARWDTMTVGSRWKSSQTMLTSALVCSDLTPL